MAHWSLYFERWRTFALCRGMERIPNLWLHRVSIAAMRQERSTITRSPQLAPQLLPLISNWHLPTIKSKHPRSRFPPLNRTRKPFPLPTPPPISKLPHWRTLADGRSSHQFHLMSKASDGRQTDHRVRTTASNISLLIRMPNCGRKVKVRSTNILLLSACSNSCLLQAHERL